MRMLSSAAFFVSCDLAHFYCFDVVIPVLCHMDGKIVVKLLLCINSLLCIAVTVDSRVKLGWPPQNYHANLVIVLSSQDILGFFNMDLTKSSYYREFIETHSYYRSSTVIESTLGYLPPS